VTLSTEWIWVTTLASHSSFHGTGSALAKTFRTIHLAKSMSFGDFPVSAVADAESLVLKPGSCQLW
jgi:hypothetical protein